MTEQCSLTTFLPFVFQRSCYKGLWNLSRLKASMHHNNFMQDKDFLCFQPRMCSIQTLHTKVICPWLSVFAHCCRAGSLAWWQLILLQVTRQGMRVLWSSPACVQKTQQLTDQDPIHAEMLECTGRMLSSAHLNDFLACCVHPSSANAFDYPLKLEHINGRTCFDCLRVCKFP